MKKIILISILVLSSNLLSNPWDRPHNPRCKWPEYLSNDDIKNYVPIPQKGREGKEGRITGSARYVRINGRCVWQARINVVQGDGGSCSRGWTEVPRTGRQAGCSANQTSGWFVLGGNGGRNTPPILKGMGSHYNSQWCSERTLDGHYDFINDTCY